MPKFKVLAGFVLDGKPAKPGATVELPESGFFTSNLLTRGKIEPAADDAPKPAKKKAAKKKSG